MSYTEIKNLPVRYRSWYINRIMEDFQKQKDALEKSSNQIELKRPDESFDKAFKMFSKE